MTLLEKVKKLIKELSLQQAVLDQDNEILRLKIESLISGEEQRRYEEKSGRDLAIDTANEELSASNEELNSMIEELHASNEEMRIRNHIIEKERAQFISLLDSIPELIYVSDMETGEVLFANKKLQEIIGRDITGEKCYEAIQGRDESCEFCTNKIIKNTDDPYFWEHYNKAYKRYFYIMDRKIEWTDHKKVRFELAIDITERKKIEEQNKKLTIAVEQNPVTVVITDLNGNIEYVNPVFEKQTGYTMKEAVGKNPRILKSGKTDDLVFKDLWKTISTGKTWRGQFINKTKSGGEYIEKAVIAPIFNDQNEKTHYIAIKEDVTEKVKTEERIKRNEAMLRIAFETSNIGIMYVDKSGKIFYANKEATKIFGYSKAELYKMTVNEFSVAEDKNISPQFINLALQKKAKDRAVFEKRYHHKKGHVITCEVASALLRDSENKPLYFISHIKDITKEKQAEENLRKSEEKYRLITENASDVIWVFNVSRQELSYISPSVLQVHGYNQEEALKADALLEEDYAKKAKERVADIAAQFVKNPKKIGQRSFTFEARGLHKDGSSFWVEIKNSYRYNKKGEIEILGISRNIDQRKKLEQQLTELNDTKDRFISVLGHDLRNPFSSIISFTNVLLSDVDDFDKEEILEFVRKLNESAKQTYGFLNNLLEWSRCQQNKIPFNPNKVVINDLIHETCLLLTANAESKKISIEEKYDGKIYVEVDNEMIKTVIRNLISNAIKFTGEYGKVVVSAKKLSRAVQVVVSDTGKGMSDDVSQSLFIIGKNRSEKGTQGEKGAGFGLLLCKEFIDKHKGTIEVKSKLNKGSKFIVTLPEKVKL